MARPVLIKANKLDNPSVRNQIRTVLAQGELVAFPTETVYGVGCDGFSRKAVKRLAAAKQRGAGHPFALYLSDPRQAEDVVAAVPPYAHMLMESFWPGPLTIILTARREVLPEVTAGLPTVGLRFPDHAAARTLPLILGRPLAATSANRSGRPSPTTVEHVQADLGAKVAVIIDDGPSPLGIESTVIDLSGDMPRILRPGTIDTSTIEDVLGCKVAAENRAHRRSYQPKVPVYIVYGDDWGKIKAELAQKGFRKPAGLGFSGLDDKIITEPLTGDGRSLGMLYAHLRNLEAKADVILVRLPREGPFADLLTHRLQKAATGTIRV